MRRSLFLVGLLLFVAACGHRPPETVRPVDNPVRVAVNNLYGLPMEIYAVGSGINHRLGLVNPGMTADFKIPQNLLGSGTVTLEAHPTARGPLFRSGEMLLAPGSVVDLTINAQLFSSTAVIRP